MTATAMTSAALMMILLILMTTLLLLLAYRHHALRLIQEVVVLVSRFEFSSNVFSTTLSLDKISTNHHSTLLEVIVVVRCR